MLRRLFWTYFCLVAVVLAIRRNDQGNDAVPVEAAQVEQTPTVEEAAPVQEAAVQQPQQHLPVGEEVIAAEPIPGSQTWWNINKLKRDTHKCGESQSQYCCIRGCKYVVESDDCSVCQGHNVRQPSPEKEIEQYQIAKGKFRIPSGIDYKGPVRGCTKKNAVTCFGKDGKKACCCNSGFIFDFNVRECVADTEDPNNKEEPIPGTENWGAWLRAKRKAAELVTGNPVKRCTWHPKKWCCNRGCSYLLDQDKCGNCKNYEEKLTPPKEIIQKFIKDNGNYVIPRSMVKPRIGIGTCPLKNSKKCTAKGSAQSNCCCYGGMYFSFPSRSCVDPAQQQREEKQAEEEDAAAEEAAKQPPQWKEDEAQSSKTPKLDSHNAQQQVGPHGGTNHMDFSLALVAFTTAMALF